MQHNRASLQTMMIFLTIVCIFIVALLLNEYYFHIVLSHQQEHKILKGLKGKYDKIAFGSSYGLYGISFPKETDGFNFCLGGQFFYYTDKMLREYVPICLKPRGTVYLVIADLVFARLGKGLYRPERYPLLLSKDSLGRDYSYFNYIRNRFPLFFNVRALIQIVKTLFKGTNNSYDLLKENKLNYEQTLQQARKRCASWCRQFGLKDTVSDVIPSEFEKEFMETRAVLTRMIQFCLDKGFNPILVVTPVSKAMNECLSEAFMNKVLFDNIKQANKQNVPLLNYLRDDRFQDISLYANNADFLNARGRKLFTNVLLNDTKKFHL